MKCLLTVCVAFAAFASVLQRVHCVCSSTPTAATLISAANVGTVCGATDLDGLFTRCPAVSRVTSASNTVSVTGCSTTTSVDFTSASVTADSSDNALYLTATSDAKLYLRYNSSSCVSLSSLSLYDTTGNLTLSVQGGACPSLCSSTPSVDDLLSYLNVGAACAVSPYGTATSTCSGASELKTDNKIFSVNGCSGGSVSIDFSSGSVVSSYSFKEGQPAHVIFTSAGDRSATAVYSSSSCVHDKMAKIGVKQFPLSKNLAVVTPRCGDDDPKSTSGAAASATGAALGIVAAVLAALVL